MNTLFSRASLFLSYIFVPVVTLFLLSKMLHIMLPIMQIMSNSVSANAQNTASGPQNASSAASTTWHAPPATQVNSLSSAVNSTGVYGFVFNTSQTPADRPFSTYNWCNMPHVRKHEYVRPPLEYELEYVEVIHRHHKRTPYSSNLFPLEVQQWSCDNAALYFYGQPNVPGGNTSASSYWSYYQSTINPFVPAGFPPHTCAFPQITKEGLDDSFQHGRDLYGVYHDLLGLIPSNPEPSKLSFRVTNNLITSQVAGMLINGMFGPTAAIPLSVQAPDVDSLEPTYTCPSSTALYTQYGSGSTSSAWMAHLEDTAALFARLDAISGVDPSDRGWHMSFDHYFDNLSARLCHQHPLPCNSTFSPERCVTQADADEVFRMGEYEYAFQYRSAGAWTLQAAKTSFGVWIEELAGHFRDVVAGTDVMVYRHNVAHDGSLSRLLSVLQVSDMVWPGMGSEVVFELYRREGEYFVRTLWSGQVLRTDEPALVGDENGMVPLARVLGYLDTLLGKDASLIVELCDARAGRSA